MPRRCLFLLLYLVSYLSVATAADPPSAVGAMLNLLKSGRVPESRLETIVKLVCGRGNEHDLAYVFSEVQKPDHWPPALREQSLNWLLEAAETRKVTPAGDLSALGALLAEENSQIQAPAIKLAGEWRTTGLLPELEKYARKGNRSALLAMKNIDANATRQVLQKLSAQDQPFATRQLAASVLATINVKQAAELAAEILQTADQRSDPALLIDAFLKLQGGSKVLAAAIEKQSPSSDIALLSLRHMYSLGRSDPELSQVLAKLAGIAEDPAPLSREEVLALAQEITATGDPIRGEHVFRRKDLSCMKCHAVSKAGGQIGPDLSAIGASSPVDYLITSILDPDQAIKEAYTTKIIVTIEGKIHQGIAVDRTSDSLVLKDATGATTSIPIDDIDEEVTGKSLMPKGLVKFMTQTEFADLVKFLSTLGKPGRNAIRSTQRMQRWLLLNNAPAELLQEVPTLSSFEDLALRSKDWGSVYARVNGDLPLEELTELTGNSVVYVQGELQVTQAGLLRGVLDSAQGIHVWLNDSELGSTASFEQELPTGIHRVTLRIDTQQRENDVVQLRFERVEGSKAEFIVVDGK